MIQYIYFVKCPGSADEHFDFFEEARAFALGCLTKKPTITQTETERNDFGECVNSVDLGTVWSWAEAIAEDTEDLKLADEAFSFSFEDSELDDNFLEDDLDNEIDQITVSFEELVEELEKNEDVVECKECEDLFDKAECRYEVDLGYLCSPCTSALVARGETLTFTKGQSEEAEGNKKIITEDYSYPDEVELEYEDLEITIQSPKDKNGDWTEEKFSDSFTYKVDSDSVLEVLWDKLLTDKDVESVKGGFKTLEDDEAFKKFISENFETLITNHYDALLDYYKEDAVTALEEVATWDMYKDSLEGDYIDSRYTDKFFEGCKKNKSKNSMLEVLEDDTAYSLRLQVCPECGTQDLDPETAICINCGANFLI